MALLREGRADEAATLLDQQRGDPRIDPVLAFAMQLAGRLDEASDAYGRAIEHASAQLAGLHVNRGQTLSGAGRYDEAAAAYEAALTLAPDVNVARINLGTIRHRQGRLADAERVFRDAVTC